MCFLCFELLSSTLIFYFLTIGALLPSSSGFRRPWRQGCPGCLRGSPCHLRLSGALSCGQIVFGKASFRFVVLYLGGGPPITCVYVFDFPFEEDDRSLEVALEAYGAVKSVKKQTFLFNQNIFNGTRLVDVTLYGVLPRFLTVDGYLRRLWYLGQPLVCNLCAVHGRRSANCPNKDKMQKVWANRALCSELCL